MGSDKIESLKNIEGNLGIEWIGRVCKGKKDNREEKKKKKKKKEKEDRKVINNFIGI